MDTNKVQWDKRLDSEMEGIYWLLRIKMDIIMTNEVEHMLREQITKLIQDVQRVQRPQDEE